MLVVEILIYVVIVRVSVNVGYRPIPSGLVYGFVFGVGKYVGFFDLQRALTYGVAAGVACGVLIWLMDRFQSENLIWWPVFVAGVFIPIWIHFFF